MTQTARKEEESQGAEGFYEPLIRCICERRSIRSFHETQVPDEIIMKILEAGRWAPSGGNSQPWEFIVVKRRDILEKICEIFVKDREQRIREKVNFPGSSKAYIAKVPAMIVVVADPRWKQAYPSTDFTPTLRRMYARNREFIFVKSVAAAVQNMFLAAASLGLGMAWLTGFAEDRMGKKLRRLLKVPEPVRLMAGLPAGYPKVTYHTKFRRPLQDLIHYETYDPTRLKRDDFFRNYCENERNRMTYSAGRMEK
ncbi:MAG: nitroreductase family protein [Candidatus Tectomicrobia bacterium]|uniref:Nitroreductase family protein n=1 Tax=Tectimicrobiota bacterium TaxID=2528274 RepID=A0A932GNW6_UNCTE|nr:nitroreductase family protein [Candidatus Tectomicrobia bacterium]